jgi:FKBP-type peptidyl-prolyl cis-trans isomerase
MKKITQIFLILIMVTFVLNSVRSQALNTEIDTVSYCVGMMVAQSVMQQMEELEYDAFIQAFKGTIDGEEVLFTNKQAQQFLNKFGAAKQEAQKAEQIAAGQAFLEENAKRTEVTVLENGLQYEILAPGADDGKRATATDRVKVHYHGTLTTGEVFDSSVERGEPASFGLNEVIKGWTEILQLMPVGSKWKVYIPEDLGYGPRGTGIIKPFSALVFEIELLEIL